MKERLDLLLVRRGLCPTRQRARMDILEGHVFVDGRVERKPGRNCEETVQLELVGESLRYVSRGGLKLEKALRVFSIRPEGFICVDCGASTGGFTDVLLQNGAARVYAVDVGYGQLDYKLRIDERVVNMENYNFRYAVPEDFPEESAGPTEAMHYSDEYKNRSSADYRTLCEGDTGEDVKRMADFAGLTWEE